LPFHDALLTDKDRDNLAEHYESHKQDLLKRTKEGKGTWKAELASNSEENVRLTPLRYLLHTICVAVIEPELIGFAYR
jgi:hypothetical protein